MSGVSLSLVVIKTRQVDALRLFYGAIGLELAEERHGTGPVHFAGRVGEVVFEVYPLSDKGPPTDGTTRLGFVVPRLMDVLQVLQALSSPIASEPQQTEWGVRAVVRDPDGRAVELYQR